MANKKMDVIHSVLDRTKRKKNETKLYRVYSGELVKKSIKQASIYVSGKLNSVFST